MDDASNPAPAPEPATPPASATIPEPNSSSPPPANEFDLASLTKDSTTTDKKKERDRPRLSPERFRQEVARFDRVLVLLVLAFGFFLASFTARNADIWLHLATGRALVQGQYDFGTDPFGSTTSGVYWANPSWLCDWAAYGLVQLRGGMPAAGAALVLAKALLITLLAGFMLAIRRRGESVWLPALCAALALLTMSPRLLLQPIVVSFLFLGVTLWVLAREGKTERTPDMRGWRLLLSSSRARLYVLPVLFLLWANLDAWFLLGPLLVALYLLGEVVDRFSGRSLEPCEIMPLLIVGILGTAACLISPHHYHAFVLPPESLPAAFLGPLKDDALFHGLFVSPFASGYFSNGIGGNAAGIAYFVLLGLGLFSFGLQPGYLRGWRVAVWLPLAVWSMVNIRAIGFFAVVAGPITALNLQEFAVRCFGAGLPVSRGGQRWALLGRFGTILGLAGLLALAWPGWLQTNSADPAAARRVAWGVELNPSWQGVAEQLAAWRKQGVLVADGHGFSFNPELANYCAWFCPEEKGFFDFRFSLFANAAPDFLAVRRAIFPGLQAETKLPADRVPWRQIFRQRHVNHIVVAQVSDQATIGMLANENEWTPLYLDGRAAIYRWRDPGTPQTSAFAKLRFDLSTRAFGPDADLAPGAGPARAAQLPNGWHRYLYAPQPHPLGGDEAVALVDLYYPMMAQIGQAKLSRNILAWIFAGLPCLAATGDGLTAGTQILERMWVADVLFSSVVGQQDLAPPEAPLVALRAARRAIAANPDDGRAYAGLARSAEALWKNQENRWAGLSPTPRVNPQRLGQLRQALAQRRQLESLLSDWVKRSVKPRQLVRQVELVWAWQEALLLGQDVLPAHRFLTATYWQMGYYDLALEHFREFLKLFKDAGPKNQDKKAYDRDVQGLEEDLIRLEKGIQDLRTDFELASANGPPLERANLALIFGLAREAMKILAGIEANALGPRGAEDLIYLYLTTGQLAQLSGGGRMGVLVENLRAPLGPAYEWNQTILAAACGNYDLAGQALDRFLAARPDDLPVGAVSFLQNAMFTRLQTPSIAPALVVWDQRIQKHLSMVHLNLFGVLAEQGELRTLRGLIALEQGDIEMARKQFGRAVQSELNFESRPIAVRYLQLLNSANAAK